ncbi:MAG: hypothetical protein RSB55_02515 [Oscillospiraceae bacterium]
MTEHNHCNCGCEDHHHEEHIHEAHCDCGCETQPHQAHSDAVTENQADFLRQLMQSKALPVARFLMTSSREAEFSVVSLAPVFLRSPFDDMDTVKEAGRFLTTLEKGGLLTLDYDIPLKGYDYAEYKISTLYTYFEDTVRVAKGRTDFLGDQPELELGSMAITEDGMRAILNG